MIILTVVRNENNINILIKRDDLPDLIKELQEAAAKPAQWPVTRLCNVETINTSIKPTQKISKSGGLCRFIIED